MDKLTQLFIRACKSKNPEVRVRSVYRRFYCNDKHVDAYIKGILVGIVDKYMNVSVLSVMADLDPEKYLQFGTKITPPYGERCFTLMISYIRLSNIDRFPGLTSPRMFRS